MPDRIDISVKLKEQRKLGALGIGALFDQYTFAIEFLLQDLCSEPLRNEGNLKIASITVVGDRSEVDNSIRIEWTGFTFRIKRNSFFLLYD